MSKPINDIEKFEEAYKKAALEHRPTDYPDVFEVVMEKVNSQNNGGNVFWSKYWPYITLAIVLMAGTVYLSTNDNETIEEEPASIESNEKQPQLVKPYKEVEVVEDATTEANNLEEEELEATKKQPVDEKLIINKVIKADKSSEDMKPVSSSTKNNIEEEELDTKPEDTESLAPDLLQNPVVDKDEVKDNDLEEPEDKEKSDWELFIDENSDSSASKALFKKKKQ